MIRPGTDLALNYALIHTILKEGLEDKVYVHRWVKDIKELKAFVELYTPEWAAEKPASPPRTSSPWPGKWRRPCPGGLPLWLPGGAPPQRDLFPAFPHHPNALMGSIETPGGLFFKKGMQAVGREDLGKYVNQDLPKPSVPRFDGSGGAQFPIADAANGNPQMLAHAILNEDPYPIKALLVNRFEALGSIRDSDGVRRALDKLDLLVAIEINYSQTAWYADVILPESTYLEKGDSIQAVSGLKPQLFIRNPAVTPRYDTKPGWWIIKELARRLGVGQYLPYETIEDIWEFSSKAPA